MATAAKALKNDKKMRDDLEEISHEILDVAFTTDFGKMRLAEQFDKGRQKGLDEGRLETERRIFVEMCKHMPEERARQITGYFGPAGESG